MALTDKLKAIADAIRAKTGKTEGLTLDAMPAEIDGIIKWATVTFNFERESYLPVSAVGEATLWCFSEQGEVVGQSFYGSEVTVRVPVGSTVTVAAQIQYLTSDFFSIYSSGNGVKAEIAQSVETTSGARTLLRKTYAVMVTNEAAVFTLSYA